MPASAKPARGTFIAERSRKRRQDDAYERREKAKVRERDVWCQWPRCGCRRDGLMLEVAHVVPKSLGGSSDAKNMILLCSSKHRGSPSLHSQELSVEPLSPELGTNGPCEFYRFVDGAWHLEVES